MRKPRTKTKLKTSRAAAKRFKLTANGKVKRGHAMKRHILTKKKTARKRRLRAATQVAAADTPRVLKMLLA